MIKIVIGGLVGGVLGLVHAARRRGPYRRLLQRARLQHDELRRWVEHTDWKLCEGTEFDAHDVAEHITGLSGEPLDWSISARLPSAPDRVHGPLARWEYGSVMTRQTATGPLVVVGCWREDHGNHHVFGSLRTDGVFERYTVDFYGDYPVHYEGRQPELSDGPSLVALLAPLPRPVRLRLVRDRILLYCPGWLSPARLEEVSDLVLAIHRRLPRRPDGGPMR